MKKEKTQANNQAKKIRGDLYLIPNYKTCVIEKIIIPSDQSKINKISQDYIRQAFKKLKDSDKFSDNGLLSWLVFFQYLNKRKIQDKNWRYKVLKVLENESETGAIEVIKINKTKFIKINY